MDEGLRRLKEILGGLNPPQEEQQGVLQVVQQGREEYQQQQQEVLQGRQEYQQQQAAFVDSFNERHLSRVTLIKNLIQEQAILESNLLTEYDSITLKIGESEKQFEALEILNADRKDITVAQKERRALQGQRVAAINKISLSLNKLRAHQQQVLQSHGLPFFKVSDQKDDLTNQYWVLAPYLQAARQ